MEEPQEESEALSSQNAEIAQTEVCENTLTLVKIPGKRKFTSSVDNINDWNKIRDIAHALSTEEFKDRAIYMLRPGDINEIAKNFGFRLDEERKVAGLKNLLWPKEKEQEENKGKAEEAYLELIEAINYIIKTMPCDKVIMVVAEEYVVDFIRERLRSENSVGVETPHWFELSMSI